MNKIRKNLLRVITLSGVEEVGRNCYLLEVNGELHVIDFGMGFARDDNLGIDVTFPDIGFLTKNKKRIKSIIVTHGHMDHIGAIQYFWRSLGFPTIYGTKFTTEMILSTIRSGWKKQGKVIFVPYKKSIKIGNIWVRFIHITHSIPESAALEITTPYGTIFVSGDYKFDNSPLNESLSDYAALKEVGGKRPILAMLDSTNVFESGNSKSEKEVYDVLFKVFKQARSRIIVTTFSSQINRIYAIFDIAYKLNKKIVILGKSMKNAFNIAIKSGYVQFYKDKVLINMQDVKKYPTNRVVYLVTGTQGEEMSVLTRLAHKKHEKLQVKRGDTVIFSSSIIPGNDAKVQDVTDSLLKLGANVVNEKIFDIHASGHAYPNDMKRMVQLVRPKFIMPVHGHLAFLVRHKDLLSQWGVLRRSVLIPQDGSAWLYNGNKWIRQAKYNVKAWIQDGKKYINLVDPVLEERRILASNGVIVINGKSIETYGVVGKAYKKDLHALIEKEIARNADENTILRAIKSKFGKTPVIWVS